MKLDKIKTKVTERETEIKAAAYLKKWQEKKKKDEKEKKDAEKKAEALKKENDCT